MSVKVEVQDSFKDWLANHSEAATIREVIKKHEENCEEASRKMLWPGIKLERKERVNHNDKLRNWSQSKDTQNEKPSCMTGEQCSPWPWQAVGQHTLITTWQDTVSPRPGVQMNFWDEQNRKKTPGDEKVAIVMETALPKRSYNLSGTLSWLCAIWVAFGEASAFS